MPAFESLSAKSSANSEVSFKMAIFVVASVLIRLLNVPNIESGISASVVKKSPFKLSFV